MKNVKNRKRITLLVLAFVLLFSVGAAFAAAPGQLIINGRAGVHGGIISVIWVDAQTHSNWGDVHQYAYFTPSEITWGMEFFSHGEAILMGTFANHGTVPVHIHGIDVFHGFPIPGFHIEAEDLQHRIVHPGEYVPYTVTAIWMGPHFPHEVNMHTFFTININYEPIR